MAAYAGMRYPRVFGRVLAQSGAFQSKVPRHESEGEWLTRQYAVAPRQPLEFYLDAGRLETAVPPEGGVSILTAVRHLRDVLEARDYRVNYFEFEGGHDYVCWTDTLARGILALLPHRGATGGSQAPVLYGSAVVNSESDFWKRCRSSGTSTGYFPVRQPRQRCFRAEADRLDQPVDREVMDAVGPDGGRHLALVAVVSDQLFAFLHVDAEVARGTDRRASDAHVDPGRARPSGPSRRSRGASFLARSSRRAGRSACPQEPGDGVEFHAAPRTLSALLVGEDERSFARTGS